MSNEFDPCVDEWESFVNNVNHNLIEKCLKLSQILEYPKLDIELSIQKLNNMGTSLRDLVVKKKNPTYQISMLNEYLFDTCQFQGDVEDYYNPKNNFMNYVIDKKIGLPITLSIIYSEIAKYIDLDVRIVGFPSHVVVKYGEEMIMDPFHGGKLLSIDDLQEILYSSYGEAIKFLPEFLNEISTEQILIRMLRNLKKSYTESFSYKMAIRCNKMILAIMPDSSEEIRDLGIIEKQMSHYEKAEELLNKYLELEPNAEDVDFILELIRTVREKIIHQ